MGLKQRFRAAVLPIVIVGVTVVTFPVTLPHVVALIPANGIIS